jgi:hypothetical protein
VDPLAHGGQELRFVKHADMLARIQDRWRNG